jgi:uncharacterized protein YqeY
MLAKLNAIKIEAMKSKGKDKETLDSVREVLSSAGNMKIELRRDLTDGEVIEAIYGELKMTKDAIEDVIKSGNTSESVLNKLAVLTRRQNLYESWVPAPLTDTEIEGIVKDIIEQNGFTKKDMKAFREILQPMVKNRADGKKVTEIVNIHLV